MHDLKRHTPRKKSTPVGRGGTRGKTSGRGIKGQRAHGGHGIRPDMRDTIKKFPKIRGRGKNSNTSRQATVRVVNIKTLDTVFEDGATISPRILVVNQVINKIDGKAPSVKILSVGETKKKFTIENCIISATAKDKLEKSGSIIK